MRTLARLLGLMAATALSLAIADPATAADAALVARGKYLATASDCTACHTVPGGAEMTGGLAVATPIGEIFSTNIYCFYRFLYWNIIFI